MQVLSASSGHFYGLVDAVGIWNGTLAGFSWEGDRRWGGGEEDGDEEGEEMEMEEEEETHNIDDLLESETKGEVDRFTVVEHRPLQADID